MNLSKVLFRPVRGALEESMREVVVFDDMFNLVDYIFSTYNIVPLICFYGFDNRINWNTYIVLDNKNGLPYGYVHIPYDLVKSLNL